MLRIEKKEFVSNLEEVYKSSSSVIITHYHGLTVAQVTELRKALRSNGAAFKVVKNTLAKIAASKSGLSCDLEMFAGPTAIAYSADPIAAAKIVVAFAKANDNLKVIGGFVDNRILDKEGVEALAKMPSLDDLRGGIVGLLQAPATKIVRILNAPAVQIARVIRAYADKE